jgi:ABC-type branched-subunit amino acid transport system ATPase component/ABC-type branched-subunit amino acid transport system permease subunit
VNLVAAIEIDPAVVVLGMITGLTYGLLSTGIVLVYRTNRIINFAHGEMGAFGAAFFGLAANRWGVPYYVNLPIALLLGAGVAALAEVVVVRRLRRAPKVMSVVATLGVGQFLVLLALTVNSQAAAGRLVPEPPGLPTLEVGALIVTPSYTGILVFAPVVVIGLALFLRRSSFGLALRAAAANPEAARMAGVFASRMSTLAWAIAGALSTFTAILVLPTIGAASASSFGPGLLLRALVGAVLARMTNLPGALAGGVALGVVEGVLFANYPRGAVIEVALFLIILLALLAQSRGGSREEEKGSAWAAVQPWAALPDALAGLPVVRALPWAIAGLGLLLAAAIPTFVGTNTAITLTGILGFSTVALSVGVITGLGGQLSLGQFALAGVGATASYHVASRTGNVPLGIVYGGVAAGLASIVIGLPSLRVRGLLLTVTTLSFALVVTSWGLQQPWALTSIGVSPGRPVVMGRELGSGRSYYGFMLVVFVLAFLLVRNVRRTGFGRLLVAVRDNEDNARAFTLPARRIKLQAFLLAGFIAGVGGAAYAHTFSSIQSGAFLTRYSMDIVVMTVVGGVSVLWGPVLGAVFVFGVPAFVPLDSAGLATTKFGLLLIILYAPGGLAQVIAPVRARVIAWLGRRAGVDEEAVAADAPADGLGGFRIASARRPDANELPPLRSGHALEAAHVVKRFGGVQALQDVSVHVDRGETLGLIGPNGAGKTTLFEVLAGFTRPDDGTVSLDGADVTSLRPEARGRLGLIRSFQDAALFPTMTVLETVQLAMERRLPTSVTAAFLGLRGRERQRVVAARDLVGSMGLWAYRNKQVQELSTGTRRITELACLVALEPKVLLLDEPSSGIAQRESEALGGLLRDLKVQLDLTLVVIEHDIPLIMELADRIVAMDTGHVIADGPPERVRSDPAVVEAYLGGKVEAIERSGLLTAGTPA